MHDRLDSIIWNPAVFWRLFGMNALFHVMTALSNRRMTQKRQDVALKQLSRFMEIGLRLLMLTPFTETFNHLQMVAQVMTKHRRFLQ